MRIYPPVIAGIYLLIFLVINYFFSLEKIINYPYNLIGLFGLVSGIFLMLWAALIFKREGTTHNPHGTPTQLVINGPYRFSRNPMYLGLTIILLGIAVFGGTVLLFFPPLIFALTINFSFISREEKKLEHLFGQEYSSYKKSVRRWL